MPPAFRTAARAACAAAVGAAAAVIALAIASHTSPGIVFEMGERLRRPLATGFYGPEVAHDLTFVWTSGRATLSLDRLPRDQAWQCRLRLRAARASAADIPHIAISVDGSTRVSRQAPNDWDDITVDVPPLDGRNGAELGIFASPTFVPGPGDRRTLGVQLDRIVCAPAAGAAVPLRPGERRDAAIAVAVVGAASGLAGLPVGAASAVAVLAAGAVTVPLAVGPAAYMGFGAIAVRFAVAIAPILCAVILLAARLRSRSLTRATRAAVLTGGVLLYAQLLALFHPWKPLVDAVFHAHRLEAVMGGHYFFTQPMPQGVSFPYAIALYVFAAPWARIATDHVALLRIVVCASDFAAYLLVYWLIVRQWTDRLAAWIALILCLMLPIAFDVIGNANLTNEFGHAASTAALVVACVWPQPKWRVTHAVGLTLLCALAFLSHVSTIALLACTLLALAVLYWWRGGAGGRLAGAILVAIVLVAGVVSFALYYGHFTDVYVQALRIRAPAAVTAASPGPAAQTAPALSLSGRLREAVRVADMSFGLPLILLAAIGAGRMRTRPRGDPIALLAAACAIAFVVFVGVGVMRVNPAFQRYAAEFITRVALAVSPGAIVLAAAGAAWALRGPAVSKLAAVMLMGWSIAIGVARWMAWFGG
jgi:hypothetical protein